MILRWKNGIIPFLCLLVVFSLVSFAGAQTTSNFTVGYQGRVYDAGSNTTTFSYLVSGTGVTPDLSHFDLEIPRCPVPLVLAGYSPTDAVSIGVDPTTGIDGIKWDKPLLVTDMRVYSVTYQGNIIEGSISAAVKGGDGFYIVVVPGPSCAIPSIDVEKYVSVDGITWLDADAAPGPIVPPNTQVSFRFVVTNTGLIDLIGITLTDNVFDLSGCTLPALLSPGSFFECIIGPFASVDGQHSNIATATGVFESVMVQDSDAAYYFSGINTPTPTPTFTPTPTLTATPTGTPQDDDDPPIVIVIEGPVQEININIITIYDIDIVIDINDPILTVIQIGDIVHIEGNIADDDDTTIIIIAITIVIINVDVVIGDGVVWRDNGRCDNPPPSWAPANGWRRRCQGGGSGMGGSGMGMGGMGSGRRGGSGSGSGS